MTDLVLSAMFWLLMLFMVAAVIAAVRLGRWLLDTPEREAACFAAAAGFALSACAASPYPNERLNNAFFDSTPDLPHREFVARARGPL